MILGIEHIGVATDDPDRVAPFLTVLGMRRDDRGIADTYGVACEFWSAPGAGRQPALELVSPIAEGSAVGDRLARQGPGLHHVALRVTDVEADLEVLWAEGFAPVDAAPCDGARPAMRVAFVYLPRPGGLLVELVEYRHT